MKEGLGPAGAFKLGKIQLNEPAGLVGLRKNRYIGANLWFSYDRVLRVGPSGPALFYYLNLPCPGRADRGGFGQTGRTSG